MIGMGRTVKLCHCLKYLLRCISLQIEENQRFIGQVSWRKSLLFSESRWENIFIFKKLLLKTNWWPMENVHCKIVRHSQNREPKTKLFLPHIFFGCSFCSYLGRWPYFEKMRLFSPLHEKINQGEEYFFFDTCGLLYSNC